VTPLNPEELAAAIQETLAPVNAHRITAHRA
jgi:hypothetical protein